MLAQACNAQSNYSTAGPQCWSRCVMPNQIIVRWPQCPRWGLSYLQLLILYSLPSVPPVASRCLTALTCAHGWTRRWEQKRIAYPNAAAGFPVAPTFVRCCHQQPWRGHECNIHFNQCCWWRTNGVTEICCLVLYSCNFKSRSFCIWKFRKHIL